MALVTVVPSMPDREVTRSMKLLFYRNCFALLQISSRLSRATSDIGLLELRWSFP